MHVSKDDLAPERLGEYEGRMADDGPWRIAFERMPAHFPPPELFRGLPGDRCQCTHLGYVLRGAFRATYLDGPEEVVRAGEAYHLRPGHLVETLEDVELIEFSPREEHDRTVAQIQQNLATAS